MKKKNLISLTIAFAFLAMAITGILIYLKQSPHFVKITHTIFGLLFVGFAVFHIINNWSSITGYSKERKSGKIQKELIVAASIFGVLLIGGVTEILEPIAEAGRFFAGKRPPRPQKLEFDEIKTNDETHGTALTILLQKSKEAELPIAAIWVEDAEHKFVDNLLVPAKIAKLPADKEAAEEAKEEGKFEIADFNAKDLAKYDAKATSKSPNFDKPMPKENFVLQTNTTAKDKFFVYVEIKANGKDEVYEAEIDNTKSDVFKLKSKDNSLISNGLVEVK